MGLSATIHQHIRAFMKSNGYRRKGNRYYRIQDNLTFCIYFEQPTGVLYSGFCVIPLYIPTDVWYWTYGNRLNAFSSGALPALKVGADGTEVQDWVDGFLALLTNTIFPFFKDISGTDELNRFLCNDFKVVRRYFFCPDIDLYRLGIYTSMAEGDRDAALQLLANSDKMIEQSPHIQGYLRERYLREFYTLAAISRQPEECEKFVRNTISDVSAFIEG